MALLLLLPVGRALGAEPLPFRFTRQAHAGEVEPLYGTVRIVAANHFSIGDLVAEAVGGLVGVHGHIQHVRRMRDADRLQQRDLHRLRHLTLQLLASRLRHLVI
uniref:Putative secreted protein n=1 Tax=Ixodes ricinus TaxID=34613 RepID=A0A6B0UH62_IXORI